MPKLPQNILDWQIAFTQGLTQPFEFLGGGRIQTPRDKIPKLATDFIQPNIVIKSNQEVNQISSMERFEVYHRQYWFRLLTILQDDNVLLAHLMGAKTFNELTSAYLVAHPPQGAPLHELGYKLHTFIAQTKWNNKLYEQCTQLDHAYNACFYAPAEPILDINLLTPQELEQLEDSVLPIAKHLFLLELDYDLINLRPSAYEQNIEEPWKPQILEKKGFWAIFRKGTQILSLPLHPDHYKLMLELKKSTPLELALENMAAQSKHPEDLEQFIPEWFHFGMQNGWFLKPF